MTTPPITDQPITASDPRVQQVLALIRSRAAQSQVAPDPAPPQTAQIAPVPTPQMQPAPASTQQMQPPSAAAPTNELGATIGPSNELGAALPPAPAAPSPSQPGPIKKFLQSLVSGLGTDIYAGSQGALQKLGIPTDYEKQQNALKMGLQQQQANSLEGLRSDEAAHYAAQAAASNAGNVPYTFGTDATVPEALRGQTMPLAAANALQKILLQTKSAQDISAGKNATTIAGKEIQYGPDSYMRKGVRSVGGRIELYDKGTGEKLNDMGPDTAIQSAYARGEGYALGRAKYTPFQTTDANGSPTVISNLQAIQSGAPRMGFTESRNFLSDLVGVKQYQDILDQKISPNLTALNDPSQRAVIAHTLAESKDASPGAIQALITSGLQEGALSPQGAQLAAGILQAREFGSVARKYGGNMNGTEGLMDRIISNQASPLNSEELNRDLISNDRAFTARALGTITNLTRNAARTPARGGAAPPTPAGKADFVFIPGKGLVKQ